MELIDVALNLTSASPGMTLKSNVLDATTWQSLSNETWILIMRSEKSVIDHYLKRSENLHFDTNDIILDSSRLFHLLDFAADLASGGDTWQKLRVMYEASKVKPLLTLLEDMPNLLITAVDTFASSERLDDFVEKLFHGQLQMCDIDRYLIPPSYMRRRGLLYSITNFCQNARHVTWSDLLAFDGKYNVTCSSAVLCAVSLPCRNVSLECSFNFAEDRFHVQRVRHDGTRQRDTPVEANTQV